MQASFDLFITHSTCMDAYAHKHDIDTNVFVLIVPCFESFPHPQQPNLILSFCDFSSVLLSSLHSSSFLKMELFPFA